MSPVLVVIPLLVIFLATFLLGEASSPLLVAYSATALGLMINFVIYSLALILLEDSKELN